MRSRYLGAVPSIALLASCLGQSAANAVTTPISYVGGGFITGLTSSCLTAGFTANQGYTIIYRPAADGQNDGLVLQFQIGAVLLTAQAVSLNGKRTFTSMGITDKAIAYNSQGTSMLKITSAGNGLSVTIAGTIPNLYGDPTCTLTIQGAATQRP